MMGIVRSLFVGVLLPWLFVASSIVQAQAPTDEELKALERQIEQQEAEQAEAKRKTTEEIKHKVGEEAKRKAEEERLRAEEKAKQLVEEKRLLEEEAKKKEAEAHAPSRVFQDTLKDGSKATEMVVIPAGSFQMGDLTGISRDNEKPVHPVTIAKPFAMGKYEVTFDDYDKFANATGRALPDGEGWGRGKLPVVNVSWDDAVAYAAWLSEQTGKKYRLPSEAEWEYATRAGTTTNYWWGNEVSKDHAKYGALFGGPAAVGSFPANAFGLYDTAGNVWEWTQDCRNDNYNGAPADGAAWQSGNCGEHVGRGGSWGYNPEWLRSAYRYMFTTGDHHYYLGFRLAQDLE
jgi:formylglycine-generating enzyme required for sulfatase activity